MSKFEFEKIPLPSALSLISLSEKMETKGKLSLQIVAKRMISNLQPKELTCFINYYSDIYFIGGFGTVAWVDVKEYETLQPDKIAVDGGEQNLKVCFWQPVDAAIFFRSTIRTQKCDMQTVFPFQQVTWLHLPPFLSLTKFANVLVILVGAQCNLFKASKRSFIARS